MAGKTSTRTAMILILLLSGFAILGAGCGKKDDPSPIASTPSEPVSLDSLFAPPTDQEIQEAYARWEQRDDSVQDYRLEATGTNDSGQVVMVVSHVVNSYRHYGIIRLPANFERGGSYPVLIYNHGNNEGTGIEALTTFDTEQMQSPYLADTCIYVQPSYQGEPLHAGALGDFLSEGPKSVFDWDVDDTIALLNLTLQLVPEADSTRIVAHGSSRGGGVTYLLCIREPRIRAAVVCYGPTDAMTSSVQQEFEDVVNGNSAGPTTFAGTEILDNVIEPYLSGDKTLAEARLDLINMSAVLYPDRLPPLQVHHGEQDPTVNVEQSELLKQAMENIGKGEPYFTLYTYPDGVHDWRTLDGYGPRAEQFLAQWIQP